MIQFSLQDRNKEKYEIMIPYEVNHDFFLKIQCGIKEGSINLPEINIAVADYGKGRVYNVEELDKLKDDFDIIEKNIEEIIKIIPLPETVGHEDGEFYTGYIPNDDFLNLVDVGIGGGFPFSKKELLFLLGLLKKKIEEAKELGEPLYIVGN